MCMCVHTYAYMCMYVCWLFVYIYDCFSIYNVSICLCVSMCMYKCVYVCVHVL